MAKVPGAILAFCVGFGALFLVVVRSSQARDRRIEDVRPYDYDVARSCAMANDGPCFAKAIEKATIQDLVEQFKWMRWGSCDEAMRVLVRQPGMAREIWSGGQVTENMIMVGDDAYANMRKLGAPGPKSATDRLMFWACYTQNITALRDLLKVGGNPNAYGYWTRNPFSGGDPPSSLLHISVGSPAITAELLKAGANPRRKDGLGRTPLDIAKKSRRFRATQDLLLRY